MAEIEFASWVVLRWCIGDGEVGFWWFGGGKGGVGDGGSGSGGGGGGDGGGGGGGDFGGGVAVFVNMILMGSNKSSLFSSKKRCNFKDQWSSQLIANNPKLLTYIFVQYTVQHNSQILSTDYLA